MERDRTNKQDRGRQRSARRERESHGKQKGQIET